MSASIISVGLTFQAVAGAVYSSVDTVNPEGSGSVPATPAELPCSAIPEVLLGTSLVAQAQEASRYLQALEDGNLQRLRSMLETSIMIGNAWAVRLNSIKKGEI